MPIDDPADLEQVDRRIHIEELKRQIQKLAGGKAILHEEPGAPAEITEAFYERILAFHRGPTTTALKMLHKAGIATPAARGLSDQQLGATLWAVIRGLAKLGVYLERTDHLSDRELYVRLLSSTLREEEPQTAFDGGGVWQIDMLGGGSEEDVHLALKYYDDEDERAEAAERWPDIELPAHCDPPYDRDRHLPRPPHEAR